MGEEASYGGTIFSGCHNFTVAGGIFNSTTKNYISVPSVPPAFRMIPLGDIDLQHEIRLDKGSSVVGHKRLGGRVRRVYSAKVKGLESNMTVAMYQGGGVEEQWRDDIERHLWLRHPYFVQVCGVTASPKMYAAIFHGDLILFEDFLALHRHSPILTVYIWAYCVCPPTLPLGRMLIFLEHTEFKAARCYFYSVFEQSVFHDDCTLWIHRSTGQLCVDLVPRNTCFGFRSQGEISRPQGINALDASTHEAMVIDSLALEQYHRICYCHLSQRRRITISTATPVTINLAAVIACHPGDQLEHSIEIASSSDVHVYKGICLWATGQVITDGWTRFNAGDVAGHIFSLRAKVLSTRTTVAWLSQANHILSRLYITSNFEDCIVVDTISFEIHISVAPEDSPPGFLFLCPANDFQTGPASFRWPECPAYWSLDPIGVERLSTDKATQLGFSSIQLTTEIRGRCWNNIVYAGLHQFHQGKGYDPHSQELARHLDLPIYRLSSEKDTPFAQVDNEDPDTERANPPEEKAPVSKAFNVMLNIQLGLILLLAVSWLV